MLGDAFDYPHWGDSDMELDGNRGFRPLLLLVERD
jgi:hypothetical protein